MSIAIGRLCHWSGGRGRRVRGAGRMAKGDAIVVGVAILSLQRWQSSVVRLVRSVLLSWRMVRLLCLTAICWKCSGL